MLVMPLLLYVNNLSRRKLSTDGVWAMKSYIFADKIQRCHKDRFFLEHNFLVR